MVLIGLVLDATLSFTTVYPQVYYLLEQLFTNIKQNKHSLDIQYRVTLIHDEPEIAGIFDNEDALLGLLRQIRFYGGSTEGCEHLTKAIEAELMAAEEQGGNRMLFVFSDAEEASGNNYPDFTGYPVGLSLAGFYTYGDAYMPMMKMVNGAGRTNENRSNICSFQGLGEILEMDKEELTQFASDLSEEILAVAGGL